MRKITTILSVIYFVLITLVGPFNSYSASEKQEATKEKKIEATEEQKTTLINLYSWATILPKELIDLKNKINKEKRIKQVQDELPHLTSEMESIRWDTTMAQTSPDIQPLQVTSLQTKTQKFGVRLEKITEPINSNISFWSETRKEWMDKKEQILRIDEQEEIPMVLGAEQHKVLIETVDEAIKIIEEHLTLILSTGKKIECDM